MWFPFITFSLYVVGVALSNKVIGFNATIADAATPTEGLGLELTGGANRYSQARVKKRLNVSIKLGALIGFGLSISYS
jgi:hypothetical protein